MADSSVAAGDAREKVDFGNEVDFHGDPVLGLNRVGFHVFQSGENVTYGGLRNMPNIRFEIDANLSTVPVTDNYTSLVWLPPAAPLTDRWSGYINATNSGTWYLTGAEGTATGCTSLSPCSFTEVKTHLNDGGAAPVILTVAVGYGRDSMWVGAVDGLRINQNVYDFEADAASGSTATERHDRAVRPDDGPCHPGAHPPVQTATCDEGCADTRTTACEPTLARGSERFLRRGRRSPDLHTGGRTLQASPAECG